MADDRQVVINNPPGNAPVVGIFSLFFREAGAFVAEAYKQAEEGASQAYKQAETAVKELGDDARKREERRRMEAQARLLDAVRLAKEAGIDAEAFLRRVLPDQSSR